MGDHEIFLVINEVSAKRQKPVKRKIHLWKKADLDAMKMRLLYLIYSSMPGFPPRALLRRCWDLSNQKLLEVISLSRLLHRKLPTRDTTNLGLQERLSVSADESSELTVTRMPKGQVVNKIGRGTRSWKSAVRENVTQLTILTLLKWLLRIWTHIPRNSGPSLNRST